MYKIKGWGTNLFYSLFNHCGQCLQLNDVTSSNNDSQLQIYQSACVGNIVCECLTSVDMLTALGKIDSGIIGQIPDATAGQNDNPLWQKMCHGRITASNLYRVYTKVQSMKEAATSC